MVETLKKEWQAKILLLLFLFFSSWWILIQFQPYKSSPWNGAFGATYGIIALWGAVWGIFVANKWGGLKSILGRGLYMFALGLLLQEFGQLAYFYYVFVQHIDVPYPSLGDIGYFGSIPVYIYGTILLAQASGVRVTLQSFEKKIQAFLIPLGMLVVAYLLFLRDYTFDPTHPLTVFLDFGYPFGQAIYISLAILTYLLCKNILGGVMRSRVFLILFALFLQFLSDYMFLYQTSKGTWAAGQFNDYMYVLSYTVMTLALLGFHTVFFTLKTKE